MVRVLSALIFGEKYSCMNGIKLDYNLLFGFNKK